MACPFFYPIARREETSFVVPPRLPLGDSFDGECRAATIAFTPDAFLLESACHSGYSRRSCVHFPQDAAIDAVRFHPKESGSKSIEVQYVFERDYWPAGHGLLRYSETSASFETRHENAIVQRQAEAFVESYLRRR